MKKITLISLLAVSAIFGADVEFRDANPNFNRINPTIDQNSILSYNSSIQKAKQTVVNISTTKTTKVQNNLNSLMNDHFLKSFLALVLIFQNKEVKKAHLLAQA